ncbi:hypothetical protein AAC387_Pa08g1903 [Persea americana]
MHPLEIHQVSNPQADQMSKLGMNSPNSTWYKSQQADAVSGGERKRTERRRYSAWTRWRPCKANWHPDEVFGARKRNLRRTVKSMGQEKPVKRRSGERMPEVEKMVIEVLEWSESGDICLKYLSERKERTPSVYFFTAGANSTLIEAIRRTDWDDTSCLIFCLFDRGLINPTSPKSSTIGQVHGNGDKDLSFTQLSRKYCASAI